MRSLIGPYLLYACKCMMEYLPMISYAYLDQTLNKLDFTKYASQKDMPNLYESG